MSHHKRRSPHEGLQLLGIVEEDLTFCPSLQIMTPSQEKICHYSSFVTIKIYRKIPKISPGAYNYFSKALFGGLFFLEGLIFGGSNLWREICV